MPVGFCHSRSLRQLFSFLIAGIFSIQVSAKENIAPTSIISENKVCIQCHEKEDKQLINDWQNSVHAKTEPAVDCISCHGNSHETAAVKSRHDQTCISCHGGKEAPVAHSYSSSKHGTLMQLEKNTYDWNQSFELANYRAPGCGYCHMYQSNHNVSTTVRHDLMTDLETEKVQNSMRAVCQDCHAPRYISRLFSNGEAMLEIARKKVREAKNLIEQATIEFGAEKLATANVQFKKMQQHLKNVYLGAGHQSPDYQWWHGQPALDGDLLRIKDNIGELYRLKK
jgi:hydroxylamine dehydrogenase